jgi:hypothetical protein
MQSRSIQSDRRGIFIAACLAGALIAQTAMAGCPPGYRSKAGHCIPGPVQTHHPVAIGSTVHAPTAASPVHAKKPRTYTHGYGAHVSGAMPAHTTRPVHTEPKPASALMHSTHQAGPAPAASSLKYDLRAQHEAKSDTRGIIFVGGKQALNPQPIPPGHAVRTLPHPGAPSEQPAGH